MGLDVYLFRCKNLKANEEYEKRRSEAHDKIWEEGEKNWPERCDAWDETNPPSADAVEDDLGELDSKKYPEHLFKLNYLRSSYNGSGFNSVMKSVIGRDLYDIFSQADQPNGYKFIPNWSDAKKTAELMLADYRKSLSVFGNIQIVDVSQNSFMELNELPKGKEGAMALFKRELASHKEDLYDYINRNGHFFLKNGVRVLAVINGADGTWLEAGGLRPVTYMVVADPTPIEESWYLQALEVTIEMIDFVLAQPNPNEYGLRWSS